MTREEFKKLTKEKIVILDGSSGVALQQRGMPAGVCPEQWAIDNESALIELQKEYIKAGSDIIYTFTFGANDIKLNSYILVFDSLQAFNYSIKTFSSNE